MTVKEITPDQLKEQLSKGETLNIIDVREDEEVVEGMIPEAIHIKMGDIPEKLDLFQKDQSYIFVCRSGRRSENVCIYLQDKGFDVANMIGGMLEWTGDTKPKTK
ncbi:rhodanese-like domain-containing protein [Bacillus sp. CLL-7-23]|uniref:Rhodanese-like domain-containing protein n=1 Tax=Bacillus changyiensis TaxID=3004103 RepID=A0ABT4X4T0_9BACI|nr:rhodanese-like domain-containing protein [Bacillus changyiensis]MDA7027296.1 rhodanese-like domain-containing protein [Bacillus changyiensis]